MDKWREKHGTLRFAREIGLTDKQGELLGRTLGAEAENKVPARTLTITPNVTATPTLTLGIEAENMVR